MAACAIIDGVILMPISLLFRADAHVGPVSIEPAERYLDKPLGKVQLKEQRYRNQRIPSVATAEKGYRQHHADNQHLDLLERMGGLVTFHLLRESVAFVLTDKDVRTDRQCRIPLLREMLRIYLLQFHNQ